MFKWNVEDMALMNEKNKWFVRYEQIYGVEKEVSREDKIAFVDSMQNGKLSYLLELQEKFDKEKETLPKDQWGAIKTVSLKAWIRRNDTKYARPIIDDGYHYGEYRLCGVKRNIQSNNSYGQYDTYKDVVDECFHRQLILCEDMERKYFREHDEYSILSSKIYDYRLRYDTTFGVCLGTNREEGYVYDVCDEDGKASLEHRKLTLEEARLLVSKYEELEDYIKKLSSEVSIKYAEELDEEKITQKNNNYERD